MEDIFIEEELFDEEEEIIDPAEKNICDSCA